MAIQLDISRIAAQTTTAAATQEDAPSAQGAKKSSPILSGSSLTVSSGAMSDLEALVAHLKNETDNAKTSVSQVRISVLNTVLDSMKDRVTQAERDSLIKIEELNGQKAEAEAELADFKSQKTASEGRIAELDMMIDMLEKQIEQAVQDGKDHREQVEKLKEQRAEEQAKLDQIDVSISSVSAKIAGIDAKIAECSDAIASTTLNEVSRALREASAVEPSSTAVDRPDSAEKRSKEEQKAAATDIGNAEPPPDFGQRRQHRIDAERAQRHQRGDQRDEFEKRNRRGVERGGRRFDRHCPPPARHPRTGHVQAR
jgi:chromosome segregation ATPase